jgi:hypothetical protein
VIVARDKNAISHPRSSIPPRCGPSGTDQPQDKEYLLVYQQHYFV